MFPYANTSIELFNQLSGERYTGQDLRLIVKTYELAKCLFAGRVLESGKEYISHVVRTASILGSLQAPSPVVAAGLIHNAYQKGDFGYGKRGISNAKRRMVRKTLGQEVEGYIAGFHFMKLNEKTFSLIRDELELGDQVYRYAVLLHLADHLEHNLDYGVLYRDERVRNQWLLKKNVSIVIEMAEKLGYPTLAKDLNWVFRENARADIPMEACWQREQSGSFHMIPLSCRKRWSIVVYETLANLKKRLRHQVARKPHS